MCETPLSSGTSGMLMRVQFVVCASVVDTFQELEKDYFLKICIFHSNLLAYVQFCCFSSISIHLQPFVVSS